jgi:TPR repeat protein
MSLKYRLITYFLSISLFLQGCKKVAIPLQVLPKGTDKNIEQIDCKFGNPLGYNATGDYSDSEEEDSLKYPGVYNLTKSGNYHRYPISSIGIDIDTVHFSDEEPDPINPIKNSDKTLISNYASNESQATCDQLKNDAGTIWNHVNDKFKNGDKITILCVALRKNDGHVKKFVFTNQPSIYQWFETYPNTKETMKEICNKAHELGYHVIMAQQSHAEGELLQFLQERKTSYTHLMAMGCDKDHCPLCANMMQENGVFGDNLKDYSRNEVSNKYSDNWYVPTALRNALNSRGFKFEKQFKQENIPTYNTKLWGQERWHNKLHDNKDKKKENTKKIEISDNGTNELYNTAEKVYDEIKDEGDFFGILHDYYNAANSGHAKAAYKMGWIYENGDKYVDVCISEAMKWYKMAIQNSHTEAEKAFKRCLKCINYENGSPEDGNMQELFNEGEKYYRAEDYVNALYYYYCASNLGHGESNYSIGYMYENGLWVDPNIAEAIKWHQEAIRNGYQKAEKSLKRYLPKELVKNGLELYNKGNEFYEKQDYKKAKNYYQKAIKSGHTKAVGAHKQCIDKLKQQKKK